VPGKQSLHLNGKKSLLFSGKRKESPHFFGEEVASFPSESKEKKGPSEEKDLHVRRNPFTCERGESSSQYKLMRVGKKLPHPTLYQEREGLFRGRGLSGIREGKKPFACSRNGEERGETPSRSREIAATQ